MSDNRNIIEVRCPLEKGIRLLLVEHAHYIKADEIECPYQRGSQIVPLCTTTNLLFKIQVECPVQNRVRTENFISNINNQFSIEVNCPFQVSMKALKR